MINVFHIKCIYLIITKHDQETIFFIDLWEILSDQSKIGQGLKDRYVHLTYTEKQLIFVPTISKVICCHCEVVEMKWELKPTNHHCPSLTNQVVLLASHQFIS